MSHTGLNNWGWVIGVLTFALFLLLRLFANPRLRAKRAEWILRRRYDRGEVSWEDFVRNIGELRRSAISIRADHVRSEDLKRDQSPTDRNIIQQVDEHGKRS